MTMPVLQGVGVGVGWGGGAGFHGWLAGLHLLGHPAFYLMEETRSYQFPGTKNKL